MGPWSVKRVKCFLLRITFLFGGSMAAVHKDVSALSLLSVLFKLFYKVCHFSFDSQKRMDFTNFVTSITNEDNFHVISSLYIKSARMLTMKVRFGRFRGLSRCFFLSRCWSFPISANLEQSQAYRQELWLLIFASLARDGSSHKLRSEMALTQKGIQWKSRQPKRNNFLCLISLSDFNASISF